MESIVKLKTKVQYITKHLDLSSYRNQSGFDPNAALPSSASRHGVGFPSRIRVTSLVGAFLSDVGGKAKQSKQAVVIICVALVERTGPVGDSQYSLLIGVCEAAPSVCPK